MASMDETNSSNSTSKIGYFRSNISKIEVIEFFKILTVIMINRKKAQNI